MTTIIKQPLVRPESLRRWAVWLLAFIALAGLVNVPFAVTRIHSRTDPRPRGPTLRGEEAARPWPASTPHATPWPTPTSWSEAHSFGWSEYDVRCPNPNPGENGFSMTVQLTGWPLPVVEVKQMWWNWKDPALKGPQSDPAPSLRLPGLILNPILVGGGLFLLLIAPHASVDLVRRRRRLRAGSCADCGYLIRTDAPLCPECGSCVNWMEVTEE